MRRRTRRTGDSRRHSPSRFRRQGKPNSGGIRLAETVGKGLLQQDHRREHSALAYRVGELLPGSIVLEVICEVLTHALRHSLAEYTLQGEFTGLPHVEILEHHKDHVEVVRLVDLGDVLDVGELEECAKGIGIPVPGKAVDSLPLEEFHVVSMDVGHVDHLCSDWEAGYKGGTSIGEGRPLR